jgi:predicted TIM-barrel fold metal-dependent hydrolase
MNRLILPLLLFAGLPLQAQPRGPIVDVHVHTQPNRYEMLSDVLASTGVTRFVNLSGGQPGRGLEESLAAADLYDGRILVCVNPDWRQINAPDFGAQQAALVTKAAALGAGCLKISKALGLGVPDPSRPDHYLAVDDPRLDPMWAAAGRAKLPVMIHTGDPKVFFEPLGPNNERMAELGVHPDWSFADPSYPRRAALLAARDRLLARHRGTTFVGVHFGSNSEDIAYVSRTLAAHPNFYVDLAARVPELGRHDPAALRALFERFQDRILFGTDLGFTRGIMLGSVGKKRPRLPDVFLFYADTFRFLETDARQIPHPTPIQGNWRINAIALSPEVLRKVYRLNALKLFWKIEGPTQVDFDALQAAPGMAHWF